MLEMFSLPFMQRALIAGAALALILAALGIFVTLRKMAFFGDGIAHSSLAGIAIAILAGWAPLPIALIWSAIVALLIYRLERHSRLPSDTLIGIFFTASMAFGVLLMSRTNGYQPELLSYLFGNILAVRAFDLWLIGIVGIVIAAWLIPSYRQFTFISLAEDSAAVAGLPVKMHTMIFYVALAFATVLGVKTLGVILVSALIILPPATARLIGGSFREYVINSLIVAEAATLIGLIAAYRLDLPAGASVVMTGTLMFAVALAISAVTKKKFT